MSDNPQMQPARMGAGENPRSETKPSDNILWYLDERGRERAMQAAHDIAAAHGHSTYDLLMAIDALLRPNANSILSFWESCKRFRPRAEIRREKRERRQQRHYFLTHGKHGLKRPRGRRNA
jgi:hypothetical protein